ncbi:GNAT family N-acetyltransferase [Pseudoalteromonas sp.]|uniref:GNAT family N-acetyltransferase n=1 Tax=Pseudoalteromonas sp. TaxID=53249 RepID=UPI003563396F
MTKQNVFNTKRLNIKALDTPLGSNELCQLVCILSDEVTEHLPPSFQGITTEHAAKTWLNEQVQSSQVYGLYLNEMAQLAGLLIIYVENHHAHIGYLFAKSHWGKGLATELLTGLIAYGKSQNDWHVINGGVSTENTASAHVLTKQGFVKTPSNSNDMLHFELTL